MSYPNSNSASDPPGLHYYHFHHPSSQATQSQQSEDPGHPPGSAAPNYPQQASTSAPAGTAAAPYEYQSVVDLSIDPGAYLFPDSYYSYAYNTGVQQPNQHSQQQPSTSSSYGPAVAYDERNQNSAISQQQSSGLGIGPSGATTQYQYQQSQQQQHLYPQPLPPPLPIQQPVQAETPPTPGMYSGTSSSSSPSVSAWTPGMNNAVVSPTTSSSSEATPSFNGNMLHWSSRNLRDTTVWANESFAAAYSIPALPGAIFNGIDVTSVRHVEVRISTPRGYSTQTRTNIQLAYKAGECLGELSMEDTTVQTIDVAEFVWASNTALGACRVRDGPEIAMVQFLETGRFPSATRFPVHGGENIRYYEWIQEDPVHMPEVFTLYDANNALCAKYVGGPFLDRNLFPYMQYYWANDDALLVYSVLAITIRRWNDRFP